MPIFRYKALAETGKKIKGNLDADSYELAKEKLRKDKMLVIALIAIENKKEAPLSSQMLLAFTRELEQLLKAGLPLYESLLTIEEKYRRHRSHFFFLDVCDKLKGGHQLSSILKNYGKTFDSIYIAMVQAGEKTGALGWAFEEIHKLLMRRLGLKKKLIEAIAYPAFLGSFCLLVVIGLLLFVIPSMQELFEGRQLHPLTESVLGLSRFFQKFFLQIVCGCVGVVSGLIAVSKRKAFLQKVFQKIPLLKTILLQAALIRFCRSAAILLKGGIPLVSALQISRQAMNHFTLEKEIARAEKELAEGKRLSEQLRQSPHIPSLVTRMLAIAEETGKLPEMLQSISEIYDLELERNLKQVTTFLQPVLLLVLGGVVGLMILSILLPLTDVSSLISN